jgi:glycerol-3-phosphate dehydrogenase
MMEEMTVDNSLKKMLLSELKFGLEQEMIVKASDFFVRRTGLLYFNRPLLDQWLIDILIELKKLLHWSQEKYEAERDEMLMLINKAYKF